MAIWMDSFRVTPHLQAGEHGHARIERFTVSKSDSDFTKIDVMKYGRGFVPPGEYTRLKVNGSQWMSDTPDELRDLSEVSYRGKGRVLINGLGLGCVVRGLLAKPEVEHIDVVEIDADVIAMVGPYFSGKRCTIHRADAFTIPWPKGVRWNCAWHDVWTDICGDNVIGMSLLKRKYARRVDWQGCWCERETRRRNLG